MAKEPTRTEEMDDSLTPEDLQPIVNALNLRLDMGVPLTAFDMRDRIAGLKKTNLENQKDVEQKIRDAQRELARLQATYKELHTGHKGVLALIRAIEDENLK